MSVLVGAANQAQAARIERFRRLWVGVHFCPWYPLSPRDSSPTPGQDTGGYWRWLNTSTGGVPGTDGLPPFVSFGGLHRAEPPEADVLPDGWTQDQCLRYDADQTVSSMVQTGFRLIFNDLVNYENFTTMPANPAALSERNVRVVGHMYDAAAAWTAGHPTEPIYCVAMPDMTGGGGEAMTVNQFVNYLRWLNTKPAAFRTDDGAMIVAPFGAENAGRQPSFYIDCAEQLADLGIRIAWLWCPLDPFGTFNSLTQDPNTWGFSCWGGRNPAYVAGQAPAARNARVDNGVRWMQYLAVQDIRPRDQWAEESLGLQALMDMFNVGKYVGANLLQFITWNDWAECTGITEDMKPVLRRIFDAWRNVPPTTDLISILNRPHWIPPASLENPNPAPNIVTPGGQTPQTLFVRRRENATPFENNVFVFTSLPAPATIVVTIGGVEWQSYVAPAGNHQQKFPITAETAGTVLARLHRGGATLLEVTSTTPITLAPAREDVTYHFTTAH